MKYVFPVIIILLMSACDMTESGSPIWKGEATQFETLYTFTCNTKTQVATQVRTNSEGHHTTMSGVCTAIVKDDSLFIVSAGMSSSTPRDYTFSGVLSGDMATGSVCLYYLFCTPAIFTDTR